jgi:hypothetical protein
VGRFAAKGIRARGVTGTLISAAREVIQASGHQASQGRNESGDQGRALNNALAQAGPCHLPIWPKDVGRSTRH